MSSHRFTTRQAAVAAGYVAAKGRHALYRGFAIEGRDISGGSSVGYLYELCVRPRRLDVYEEILWGRADYNRDAGWARSVTVWFSEDLNRIHRPGCFLEMFTPDDLRSGIEAAKTAIDNFWADHPEIEARISEVDRLAAERHAKRTRRRAEKLSAKYGAENLNPEWRTALQRSAT